MPGDIVDDAVAGAQLQVAAQDKEQEVRASSLDKHERHNRLNPHMGEGLDEFPTEEEILTLRRVSDHIPPKIFTIAFIELCERFSYYGAISVVCARPLSELASAGPPLTLTSAPSVRYEWACTSTAQHVLNP